MDKSRAFSSKNIALFISLAILFFYFLPFLILGSNSFFTIGDNLDSTYTWDVLLARTRQTFNLNPNTDIPNMLDGLRRGTFINGFYITTILFYFFKPPMAYIINFILTHLIGFLGAFLLLKKHILKEPKQYTIILALSVSFAIVPFFSIYGASIPYQPLLLYAFLNLLQNKDHHRWTDYLIIALSPFFGDVVLTEPFMFIFLTAILIFQSLKNRKLYSKYIFGLGLLFFSAMLFEYSVIYQNIIRSDFHSIRDEFDVLGIKAGSYKWWAIVNFVLMLFQTQYHTGDFDTFPIIIAFLVAASIVLYQKRYNHVIFYLTAFIILTSFFFVFYYIIEAHLGNKIPIIKVFQFNRFYFLLPLVWIALFAYSIREIYPIAELRRFIWVLVTIQFIIILCFNTEVKNNIKLLLHRKPAEPTVKAYFAENQFSQIKDYIGKPQSSYRVVSLGMHPNIAIYNGFYTLDGYMTIYDVRYKHKFRRIIEGELNKDDYLKKYFDKWGGRCYIFSSELGANYLYGKDSSKTVNNLSINYDLLKEMGDRYIISAVQIKNYDTTKVKFDKEFEDKNSFWNIYLYKLL